MLFRFAPYWELWCVCVSFLLCIAWALVQLMVVVSIMILLQWWQFREMFFKFVATDRHRWILNYSNGSPRKWALTVPWSLGVKCTFPGRGCMGHRFRADLLSCTEGASSRCPSVYVHAFSFSTGHSTQLMPSIQRFLLGTIFSFFRSNINYLESLRKNLFIGISGTSERIFGRSYVGFLYVTYKLKLNLEVTINHHMYWFYKDDFSL